jgi:hypothetical protein
VLHGQAGPVELLLAVGADMEIARLDGMTAVHLAQLARHAQGHLRPDDARAGRTGVSRVCGTVAGMKLYLAGPDVFRPDAGNGRRGVRALCRAAGHQALVPLDGAAGAGASTATTCA